MPKLELAASLKSYCQSPVNSILASLKGRELYVHLTNILHTARIEMSYKLEYGSQILGYFF